MSDKKTTYEADVLRVKNTKIDAEMNAEKNHTKDVSTRDLKKQRTYSRDTVIRLIDWFKRD